MAKLTKKIRSHVETVADWPRGTRKRGFGYLHDRVWFPISASEFGNITFNGPMEMAANELATFDYKHYRLYLDRKMLWFAFGLRLHTFYMGDDDAAVHDHPWWFITFPLRSYTETVGTPDGRMNSRLVRAFRFHFRSSKHRHFVHEPYRPFRTLVFTGRLKNNWGFWPRDGKFIPHREWSTYNRKMEEVS